MLRVEEVMRHPVGDAPAQRQLTVPGRYLVSLPRVYVTCMEKMMPQSPTNPFFETNFSKFADFSKTLGDFKVPTFSYEAFSATIRKNLETVASINQATFESMQSLTRQQAEVVRQGVEEATALMHYIMSCPSPEEKVVKQAEASKVAIDKCISNAREIADTISKCNSKALETVSHRMDESIEELRGMMKKSSCGSCS